MGLTVVVEPIRGGPPAPHWWGHCDTAPAHIARGHRPIKRPFHSDPFLVFCTTTTRVELTLEARPIPCISTLEEEEEEEKKEEEEEACSYFVTCITWLLQVSDMDSASSAQRCTKAFN